MTKDDMHFNYCTRKKVGCFAILLVRPETEGETGEKSHDGIEHSVPERDEGDERRPPTE
jgi:hypothetical protein